MIYHRPQDDSIELSYQILAFSSFSIHRSMKFVDEENRFYRIRDKSKLSYFDNIILNLFVHLPFEAQEDHMVLFEQNFNFLFKKGSSK